MTATEIPTAPFLAEVPGSWAIVEIMGRRQHAGKVSEETIAGGIFLRVDALIRTVGQDGAEGTYDVETHYYGAGSIYCLTPCTEAKARAAATGRYPTSRPLGELTGGYPVDDPDDDEYPF